MEVEPAPSEAEKEIQMLQKCNEAITHINENLRTTLHNFDVLSESVAQ